jgi:hypothetical protein
MSVIPGERVIELLLEVTLEAMRGQTPEQREKIINWLIADIEKFRKFWKIDT